MNMDAETQILEALMKAGKPLRPGEIAELTGLEKDLVSKIIKSLKAAGKVDSPKRCYYAPV
jgi:DNA-binding MarR family transcriptional regulator